MKKLDIHIHTDSSHGAIEAKLDTVIAQQKEILLKIDDINAKFAGINDATNEIAEDIKDLKAQIAGGLSAAEATSVVASLDGIETKLRAVAAEHTPDAPPVP